MESARWLVLSPLVLAMAAGSLVPGRTGAATGGTAWDPPPCGVEATAPPGPGSWFRLDASLDRTGTLAGRRLTVGAPGGTARVLDQAPESFASGPVGGLVVAGEDDGSTSRVRLLDPARSCATDVAQERDVIRSAVLAADGRSLYEHRVDRTTRADLGVWRRSVAAGSAVRVLPGLDPDPVLGPTFTTDLVAAEDGRLVVSSCAPGGCRVRVLDPASGAVAEVHGVGPALGVRGGSLVTREACGGWPCAVVAVDLATGRRTTLLAEAEAAALAGGRVVAATGNGRLVGVDVITGRTTALPAGHGVPLRAGSTATAGAEVPAGWVALAPGGRPDGRSVRRLDARTGIVRPGPETTR